MKLMLKILPVIVLCITSQSCMVNRYAMEDMNCHDSWGGTVYELKHGKELVGTVFDKARMTFPGPQFEIRFTPTLEEILIADSIICENIPSIVGLAKNYSGNYYLRSRNRLKRYFRQYVGAISKDGNRIIWVNLYYHHNDEFFDKFNITKIIDVLDGGDSKWDVCVNLDKKEIFNLNIN